MDGRRRALIIATDTYDDAELGRLFAPERDAEELAEVLRDPELGAFEVEVVHNSASYEIAQRIESLLDDAQPQDLVLIHFSGHGIKNKDGELVLAATNTHPKNLFSTGVKAADVQTLIFRSRSRRKVLILDCCYGGAFAKGLVPRATDSVDVGDAFLGASERDRARGCAVITASTAMEFAFEETSLARSDATRPSIFTGALVEGLKTGKADRDQDGRVSLWELYDYVFDRVREKSPSQTPSITQFELQGELFIANNPWRVVTPGDLPAGLLDKIASDDKYVRLGAVSMLREYAAGADLPVAAAARLALSRLLGDDSRKVADDAGAALEATRLRASPSRVDFGEVRQGQGDVSNRLRVDGPPLVASLIVTPSDPRIRVRRAGRELHVEVDTSVPGSIDATIELAGPAGTETVPVRASVVEATQLPTPSVSDAEPGPAAPPRLTISPEKVPREKATPEKAPEPAKERPSVFPAAQAPTWNRAAFPFRMHAAIDSSPSQLPASEGPAPSTAVGLHQGRRLVEPAHPILRSVVGAVVAASVASTSGAWLPLVNVGDVPFAIALIVSAVIVAVGVALAERLLPAFRVPTGRLVSVAGDSPWRAAAVQGFLIGLVPGLVALSNGGDELAALAMVPASFAIGFGLAEGVMSAIDDL